MRYYNSYLSSVDSGVREAVRFLNDKEPSVDLALNRLGSVQAQLKATAEEWDKAFYALGKVDGNKEGKDSVWAEVAASRKDARNLMLFLLILSLCANAGFYAALILE